MATKTMTVRLPEETHAWLMGLGGSTAARDILVQFHQAATGGAPEAEPEAPAEAEAPGEATGVPSPPDPPTDEEPQEAKSDFTVERNAYGPGTNRVLYRGEPLGLWLNAGGRREWDSQTVFNTLVGMGLEPNIASKFAETRASVLAEDAAVVLPPTSQPSGLDAILGRRSA